MPAVGGIRSYTETLTKTSLQDASEDTRAGRAKSGDPLNWTPRQLR